MVGLVGCQQHDCWLLQGPVVHQCFPFRCNAQALTFPVQSTGARGLPSFSSSARCPKTLTLDPQPITLKIVQYRRKRNPTWRGAGGWSPRWTPSNSARANTYPLDPKPCTRDIDLSKPQPPTPKTQEAP